MQIYEVVQIQDVAALRFPPATTRGSQGPIHRLSHRSAVGAQAPEMVMRIRNRTTAHGWFTNDIVSSATPESLSVLFPMICSPHRFIFLITQRKEALHSPARLYEPLVQLLGDASTARLYKERRGARERDAPARPRYPL